MRYFLACQVDWAGVELLGIVREDNQGYLCDGTAGACATLREAMGRDGEAPEFWSWDGDRAFTLFQQYVRTPPRHSSWGEISWPRGWPRYVRSLHQWADQLALPALPRRPGTDDALAQARWQRAVYRWLRHACREAIGSEGFDRTVLAQHVKEEIERAVATEREACAQIAEQQIGTIQRLGIGQGCALVAEQIALRIRARR